MKKKIKKLIALLGTAVISFTTLSGCGSTASSESSSPVPAVENEDSASDSNSAEENTSPTDAPADLITFPLEETVTLTVFMPMHRTYANISNDYNESPFFQELEKRTNVHIEFQTAAIGEEENVFNLIASSGELPDIMTKADTCYSKSIESGVDEGLFLDLTPYYENGYLPNYSAALENAHPYVLKSAFTGDGRLSNFCKIMEPYQPPFLGLLIRQDWLDELGLEVPKTYEELEIVLTAFKEKKNAYAPLGLNGNGYNVTNNLSAGFNTGSDFIAVDGVVEFGPINEGWREYLTLFNDWYKKGLIDPDFTTAGNWTVNEELVLNNQTGVFETMQSTSTLFKESLPNIKLTALTPPTKNKGDDIHFNGGEQYGGSAACVVSADSKHKDIAVAWLDYFYSDEITILSNYGIEGDTFTYGENNEIEFTEKITNNPDMSFIEALEFNTLPSSNVGNRFNYTRELYGIDQEYIDMMDVWGSTPNDYSIPLGMPYNTEESDIRAKYFTDIRTYVDEATVAFIIGEKDPTGTDWDNYVSDIENMHLAEVTEAIQKAYDRFTNN